jgi:anti-sigma factor RsiW
VTKRHVINDFQAWNDGQVDKKKRLAIEQHLTECPDCRAYFEKMSMFLDQMDPASLPHMEADPFLPTRIRALAEGNRATAATKAKASVPRPRKRLFGRAGLTAMAVMIIAAVWVGGYFGERLSTMSLASTQYDETDIISSFYDEFAPSGFAGDWESILENGEEESNET